MHVIAVHTPYGRLGAVLSALIAAFSLIGLTIHKDFYAGIRRKDFYCFYTNLSNLIVLVYFSLIAPRLYAYSALRPFIPHAEFAVMMCIMLTFCVFHLLIFPAVYRAARGAERTREFYIVCADNVIVHYLVPWLVFLYWLLCSPGKNTLGLADSLLWTLIPILYLIRVLRRGERREIIEETGSPYPYPFLDISVLGVRRVAGICLLLYGTCLLAGFCVIGSLSALFSLFGGGHALLLI